MVVDRSAGEPDVGEVIADHKSPNGPMVRAIRGALLLAYLDRVKARDHYPQYLAGLSEEHRQRMASVTAMSWVPADLVGAHFDACDRLELLEREIVEEGYLAGKATSPVMLGTLARVAGLTPITALHALDRVWPRIYDGGSCIALRTGMKDLVIEQRGVPAARSRFYCTAGRGFYRALAEQFCTRAFVRAEKPRVPGPNAFAVSISWV